MTLDQVQTLLIKELPHGYLTISSLSDTRASYRVHVNEHLYADDCSCRGSRDFHLDCGHKLAADRYYDARRAALDEETDPIVNYIENRQLKACRFSQLTQREQENARYNFELTKSNHIY